MPIVTLWQVLFEFVWVSASSGAISLFFHVTFVLFLLSLLNLGIKKYWPGAAFSPGELMTIYLMLAISAIFSSHDMLQIMIPMLAYPHYFANPQNNWDNTVISKLPKWALLRGNEEVLNGVAVGNSSVYNIEVLKAWATPLTFWFIFLMALMGALITINMVFRKHWTEKERLSFPVIQIPVMIATQLDSLLKNKLFLLAFFLTASIDAVNGFAHFFPSMPQIPIESAFRFGDYFVDRPWNAIGNTEINLFPFVIGLVFFIPTDLAFSCWFFFVLFRLQLVVSAAIGLHDMPGFPFPKEQTGGAYIALGILAIWLSRRHLFGVARTVLGLPGGVDDSQEPIRYRWTMALMLTFFLVLVVMGRMLGASWWVMVAFFAIFSLYSIAIARMRAELGPPAHDLHYMGPEVVIHNAVGSREMSSGDIAALSSFYWFNRAYRSHISAHSMEGFKIGQLNGIRARSIMTAMVIAIVFGAVVALWALLHALYVHGYSGRIGGEAFSHEPWLNMQDWLSFHQRPQVAATVATAFGALFTLLLGTLRMRFTWWLWHPVGYATCTSWSMDRLWFCMFVGWLAKTLITRYGGAQLYRKAIPFFVGLVMGEFVVGSLWTIYSAIAGVQTYQFFGR